MSRSPRKLYPLPVAEQIRTAAWTALLGLCFLYFLNWPLQAQPSGRLVAAVVVTLVGVLGIAYQFRRNAYAYLHGKPRPRIRRRTLRPARPAEKGEVYPARGFRRGLLRMLGRVPGYREFPKKGPRSSKDR